MKRPSSTSIRVPTIGTVLSQPLGREIEHFSRIPDSVLHDKRLTGSAVRVYALLAGYTRSDGVATAGVRLIASKTCMSKNTVTASIEALESAGHISPATKAGKAVRGAYRLTSKIFRKSVIAEAGGQHVEYYESEGVQHKREIVSRPRHAS